MGGVATVNAQAYIEHILVYNQRSLLQELQAGYEHTHREEMKELKGTLPPSVDRLMGVVRDQMNSILVASRAPDALSDIDYNGKEGTHCKLYNPSFVEWFNKLPEKQSMPVESEGLFVFKVDAKTVSISEGVGKPGIQIKQQDDGSFLVCNNVAADKKHKGAEVKSTGGNVTCSNEQSEFLATTIAKLPSVIAQTTVEDRPAYRHR